MSTTIGTDSGFISDINEALGTAEKNQQDFVVAPLFHPRFRRDAQGISSCRQGPGSRSDRVLESKDWIANVVGKISEWIDLDNPSESIRKGSEQTLKQEFLWASHLGLQAVILPPPNLNSPNYARCIQQLSSKSIYQQIWIRIPLNQSIDYHNNINKSTNNHNNISNISLNHSNYDGWLAWDHLRHICSHSIKLFIALEIPEDLPDSLDSITRWRGEPVKALILSTKLFLTNKTGYPVLSKRHQHILLLFLEYRVQIIIKGRPRHLNCTSLSPYIQYIRHINSTNKSSQLLADDKLTLAYRDYLQAPLQPLMDNLESQTYEVFERDPVKYSQYEDAIALAIQDLITSRRFSIENKEQIKVQSQNQEQGLKDIINMDISETETQRTESHLCSNTNNNNISNNKKNHNDKVEVYNNYTENKPLVIAVVGAGRGPLVQCALNAAKRHQAAVIIYAIEKNANAIITLRNRCITEKWTNITVISTDMRLWKPAELADIMVSELLGSWGDNELSPECLHGAQICLKPGGISIPSSYTSYLAPISSSKLWNNAKEALEGKGLETPYVVKLHNYYQMSLAQPVFTFNHPVPLENFPEDTSRYSILSFPCTQHATMHGFSGTFHATLYKDVTLSIEPTTHSPGMFSWFPLYIPLCIPVRVMEGDIVTAHIWRCIDERRVWYEWCLSSPIATGIQNPNGRSYWIGL
eukprot:gene8129-16686_t